MVQELEDAGIEYKEYNGGKQINAKDMDGVIHSFYPTTGTVVLHASNNKYDNRTLVFRDKTIENFVNGMKFNGLTNFYFNKEDK